MLRLMLTVTHSRYLSLHLLVKRLQFKGMGTVGRKHESEEILRVIIDTFVPHILYADGSFFLFFALVLFAAAFLMLYRFSFLISFGFC